jgi:hypothetical protein
MANEIVRKARPCTTGKFELCGCDFGLTIHIHDGLDFGFARQSLRKPQIANADNVSFL